MDKRTIITDLEMIFKEVTGDPNITISEKTVITGSVGEDILQISSIDFVQAVLMIEERFNIIIDFDFPLNSVEDIIALIEHKEQ